MTTGFPAAARLGLSLRAMTDADLPFVAELFASTRAEEVAATGWSEAAQRAFLASQHDAQHAHYIRHYPGAEWWIVEQGGAAIGRLYLHEGVADLRIIDISLVPVARGHGFGGSLLHDTIDRAAAGGKSVSIHVEKHNRARSLYLRLGFAAIEDKGVYDLMSRPPGPTAR